MHRWITTSQLGLGTVIGLGVALLMGQAALLLRDADGEPRFRADDRRAVARVDRLIFTDTADAFRAGSMRRVKLLADEPARITLDGAGRQRGFPREGTWTSPEAPAEFPFTELLPSWNVATPDDTGVVFHVRTRDHASKRWTPWLRIGAWGRHTRSSRTDQCEFGRVETDVLRLNRPADAYQVRATLQSFDLDRGTNPSVRRIAVCYSGPIDAASVWAKAVHPDPGPPARWARDLNVPFRPQGDNAAPVTGMTCSPTSVSMVLEHLGIDRPTMENALAIWDDHNDLFGNWSNATQRAAELGTDAWLECFRDWDQVKAHIAAGNPIVASIEFARGTVPDAPIYQETDGHLIVIRGLEPDGRVIVNDPASRDKGNGVRYSQAALTHAWFGNGGVGYVIRRPAKPLPKELVKGPAPQASRRAASSQPSTTAPVAVR